MKVVRLHDRYGQRPAIEVARGHKFASFLYITERGLALAKLPLDGEIDKAPIAKLSRIPQERRWRVSDLEYSLKRAFRRMSAWASERGASAPAKRALKDAGYYPHERGENHD